MFSFAISVQTLFLALLVATLFLVLVVLTEISRSNRRREVGKMFASDKFDEKVAQFHLSYAELAMLERLVRQSSFSNKDSVLNSPLLFEEAVNAVYKLNRGVEKIAPADCETIGNLRKKLGHLDNASKFSYISTRQFAPGMDVTLVLSDRGRERPLHRKILSLNERFWCVPAEDAEFRDCLGRKINVRFNIPGEAIYSARVRVLKIDDSGNLVLEHSTKIHKEQLRRWIRMAVRFPVHLLTGEREMDGFLVDLSAGGILLALPEPLNEGALVHIRFFLPGFGEESLDVRILRVLHKGERDEKTGGIDHSASFIGEFGETQEHVLQYIFLERRKNRSERGVQSLVGRA